MSINKQNIVLIGMPGCGKSTCGVLAAKSLCKSFVDTDLLIQSEEGMSLQKILDQRGYEYFAALEERVLTELNARDCVIATGGSAVYYDSAMKHLKESGIIVYLNISLPVMLERVRNIRTRGILLKQNETMEDMFHSREALYLQYADIIIDCDKLSAEQTVDEIFRKITL